MRKTLLKLIAVAFLLISPLVVQAGGTQVDPDAVDRAVQGSARCTNAFDCASKQLKSFASGSGVNTAQTPETIAGRIINTAVGLLGVVAVALIVYAGGLWITAAGNDDKVEKAKGIIKTTVIGMLVVGLAYAITLFIVSFVSG